MQRRNTRAKRKCSDVTLEPKGRAATYVVKNVPTAQLPTHSFAPTSRAVRHRFPFDLGPVVQLLGLGPVHVALAAHCELHRWQVPLGAV